MDDLLYCENDECRVEMYHATKVGRGKNCPGCGQFGRKKGKQ